MPNPMLTEDDLNPPPLFRVFYEGKYLSFFSSYQRAYNYMVDHARIMGTDNLINYEIRERTEWEF